MEYLVVFLIDDQRKILVFEHVKEEYGVSEQEFWSCWVMGREHINGDGDTAKDAFDSMLKQMKKMEDFKSDLYKSIEGAQVFRTPVLGDLNG